MSREARRELTADVREAAPTVVLAAMRSIRIPAAWVDVEPQPSRSTYL
jgi:hypothetical protein